MEWDIEKSRRVCAACETTFEEGCEFFGALYDRDEGYERRDFCLDCWPPDEEPFSYWRTRIPRKDEPKHPPIDYQRLLEMFLRLEDSESEKRRRFRYILALMLMRKKLLKLEGFGRRGEVAVMRVKPTGEEDIVEIPEPELTEEEMLHLQDELIVLLETGAHALPEDHESTDSDQADMAEAPTATGEDTDEAS